MDLGGILVVDYHKCHRLRGWLESFEQHIQGSRRRMIRSSKQQFLAHRYHLGLL